MLRRTLKSFCAAPASFAEQYASSKSGISAPKPDRQRTSVQVSLPREKPGALLDALKPFAEAGLSVDQIQNRQMHYESKSKYVSIYFDVSAHKDEPAFQNVLTHLRNSHPMVSVLGSWNIPWYPTRIEELDLLDQTTLAAGAELEDDPENPHPGFSDQEYRERRRAICQNAYDFRHGQPLPTVDYTEKENATWGVVWDKLTALYPTHACQQYNQVFPMLVESGAFSKQRVPQLREVSEFLNDATGFSIRPVAGLLAARDFLNALAFRTFYSTQYIRHHSKPLYTPEPDVVHELMGHVPLFADPDFADFSQQIGLLSLGVDDATIDKLVRCYWYTVEFGICKEAGGNKAFGAGLLSSFGELEYCLTKKPELLPWDPFVAGDRVYPITVYQPTYFVADSFKDAQKKLIEFGATLDQPFRLEYNPASRSVKTYSKALDMLSRQVMH